MSRRIAPPSLFFSLLLLLLSFGYCSLRVQGEVVEDEGEVGRGETGFVFPERLNVNVVIVRDENRGADGGKRYKQNLEEDGKTALGDITPALLESFLSRALPTLSYPGATNSTSSFSSSSSVITSFIHYRVSTELANAYSLSTPLGSCSSLTSCLLLPTSSLSSSSTASSVLLDIPVEAGLEDYLESLQEKYVGGPREDGCSVTIFLLDVNAELIKREACKRTGGGAKEEECMKKEFGYRYRYNLSSPAVSWVGRGAYVVVDVAAGPVFIGERDTQDGGATVVSLWALGHAENMYTREHHEDEEPRLSLVGNRATAIGAVGNVMLSAVKNVFAPRVLASMRHFSNRLFIVLITLSDHGLQHEDDATATELPDPDTIESMLQSVSITGKQIIVISRHVYLHNHPQIAAALFKARRSKAEYVITLDGSHTVRKRTFLDSGELFAALSESSDLLASGLLSVNDDPFRDEEGEGKAFVDAEILPVYHFALFDPPADTFDGKTMVAANANAVVSLQLIGSRKIVDIPQEALKAAAAHGGAGREAVRAANEVAVAGALGKVYEFDPPYSEADAHDSTRNIIGGVLTALGVSTPYISFCEISGNVEEDWMWASGAHPFGPYVSNRAGVSSMYKRLLLRAQIVGRLQLVMNHLDNIYSAFAGFVDATLDPDVLITFALIQSDEIASHAALIHFLDTFQATIPVSDTFIMDPLTNLVQRYGQLLSSLSLFGEKYTRLSDYSIEAERRAWDLLGISKALEKDVTVAIEAAMLDLRCCRIQARKKGGNSFFEFLSRYW